jgi:hypothetical protein
MNESIRVRVYFNLHKKVWSVQDYQKSRGWRIIAHAEEIYLKNVTFNVSVAGRLRVLREKRKNVHAFAIGDVVYMLGAFRPDGTSLDEFGTGGPFPNTSHVLDGVPCWSPVRYNPYEGPTFTMDGNSVHEIPQAIFTSNRKLFGLTSKGCEVYS